MEGLTLSPTGVAKFYRQLDQLSASVEQTYDLNLGQAKPVRAILDCLAAPRQNPLGISYLCRQDDMTDVQSMHCEFFSFDFRKVKSEPGDFLYVFPPPRMTAAAAKHIATMTDISSVWIIEGRYLDILVQAFAVRESCGKCFSEIQNTIFF